MTALRRNRASGIGRALSHRFSRWCEALSALSAGGPVAGKIGGNAEREPGREAAITPTTIAGPWSCNSPSRSNAAQKIAMRMSRDHHLALVTQPESEAQGLLPKRTN